jgi:hypothetical protein
VLRVETSRLVFGVFSLHLVKFILQFVLNEHDQQDGCEGPAEVLNEKCHDAQQVHYCVNCLSNFHEQASYINSVSRKHANNLNFLIGGNGHSVHFFEDDSVEHTFSLCKNDSRVGRVMQCQKP